jgi:capsular exopolysaccharide synthesis family protein
MEQPDGGPGNGWKELRLQDYWLILMRQRGVIVAITLLAVLGAGLWVLRQKPVYRAVAILEVHPGRFNLGGDPVYRITMPFTIDSFVNTQMSIARSQPVARLVLNRLGTERVLTLLGMQSPPQDRPWNEADLADLLRGRVFTRHQVESFLIEIGVEASSPEASAILTNAWAESLIEYNRQMELQMTQTATETLSDQIQRLQRSILEKEAQLNRLAQMVQIQVLDEQINVAKQRMESLSQEIMRTQNELIDKLANLRRIQLSTPETLPEIQGNTSLRGLQEACMKAEQDYTEKARIFKPDWPGLKQLALQRDEVCARYRQEAQALYQKAVQAAEVDVRAIREKERQLRSQFDATRAWIDQLNKAAADYQTLKSEVENQRRLLNTLLERRQQAQVGSGSIQATMILRIVELARPPGSPIRPRRLRTVMMALLVGLLSGVGLAFVLHHLDNKIYSHEDIRQVVPYPFLTFIPDMEKERDPRVVQNAFRFLQGYVAMQNSGPPVRSLMVTSPQPSEGKTFVAVHLARTLAQARKRVLLIETDVHAPKFHQVFRVPRRPGLLDLRGQEATVAWDLFPAVEEYLVVIPSGASGHRSDRVLLSLEGLDMRRLIQRALEAFDYVLLDTPPILAVPEALQLAHDVESILLVVQSGHTTRPALQMAAEQLARIEAPVLGVVLNRVDLTSKYSYYTYYYPYRYYYSYYFRGEEPSKRE